MSNMIFDCLFWCVSCLHSSCVASLPWKPLFKHLITARRLLNNCSIPLNTCLFYWDFWVCSRYLSIDSPIHQTKFIRVSLCSIVAWYLLWFIEIFCPRYLSIYRDFVFNRSSIPFQSIELRFLYILLRSDPILHLFKYLDLSHLSLDPNPFFSLKSFLFLHLRPTPSLNLLVSLSNPSFSSFSHSFMHLLT